MVVLKTIEGIRIGAIELVDLPNELGSISKGCFAGGAAAMVRVVVSRV